MHQIIKAGRAIAILLNMVVVRRRAAILSSIRRAAAQTLWTGKEVHARWPAVSTSHRWKVATHPRLERVVLPLETVSDLHSRRLAMRTSRRYREKTHPRLYWLSLSHRTTALSPLGVDMATYREC